MNSSREWPCPEPATIHVHHAPGAPSAKTICIDRILPRGEDALVAHARLADDAHQIADVLYASLPAGTIDALLAEMLTRRGTQLRVPLAPKPARIEVRHEIAAADMPSRRPAEKPGQNTCSWCTDWLKPDPTHHPNGQRDHEPSPKPPPDTSWIKTTERP